MGQRQILRGRCEQGSGAARQIEAGDDQAARAESFQRGTDVRGLFGVVERRHDAQRFDMRDLGQCGERGARLGVARIETGGVDDDERFLRDAIATSLCRSGAVSAMAIPASR